MQLLITKLPRTMKVHIILLFLFFASATALASIDPQDLTIQRDVTSNTIIIRSTIALEQLSELRLVDHIGNIVFATSIAAGDFINKRFPIAPFTADKYELIFTDQRGKTMVPMHLKASDGNLAQLAKATRQMYPRVTLRAERSLVVDYVNTSGKRVDISIANKDGKTVFSDQVSGETSVQRAYQLDQLACGDYQLIVSARDVKRHSTAFALR